LIQQLNGGNYITFDLPYESEKRQDFQIESLVRLVDDYYYIRTIEDKSENGTAFTSYYCEALFYDLQYSTPLKEKDFFSEQASTILQYVLYKTGWELGTCDISVSSDFTIEAHANCLETLRKLQEVYGGDLIFNNELKTVSLLNDSSENNGLLCTYGKNLNSIIRTIDSTEVANKIYFIGENEIDISELNLGREYVWVYPTILPNDVIRHKVVYNSNISSEEELYNYAQWKKNTYENPTITYEISMSDISAVNEDEIDFKLGDIVTVFDELLEINLETRIVALDYNIQQPQDTKIVLSNKVRQLGDDMTEYEKVKKKLSKINWVTQHRIIRQFLYSRVLGLGFVSASYIEVENAEEGAIGTVKLENTNSYLNVRTGPATTWSIIGSLRHGDTVTINEVLENGTWYQIPYN
ncbi:phage tail spike protein, partial [Romboutsia sp.]|uniref:phage tail spike protein n=1 Tax=Romboutsia sp. TaxID=1965302 RepID=UPI002C8A921B